jgi:hypothetical protein
VSTFLNQPPVGFDAWKTLLRNDCKNNDKLVAFDCLGDYVLKLLWESGVEPTVRAITSDGKAFEGIKQPE